MRLLRCFFLIVSVVFCAVRPSWVFSTDGVAEDSQRPRIEEFKFSPDTFSRGDAVVMEFRFNHVKGGLQGAKEISLDFEGSLSYQTRQPSRWVKVIREKSDASEQGIFRAEIHIKASHPPPFSIMYYLSITDADGRKTNVAKAKVFYSK